MTGIVVVFDFDKTIIDLGGGRTRRHRFVQPTPPYDAMELFDGIISWDRMMTELHSQGKTIDHIAQVLKRVPIHPNVVPAIRAAHALGIQAWLMREDETKKRFIYLGDGSGDYCPSLKLGEGDFLMPRKSFPLWDLISQNPVVIKAEIHEWSDGEEMGRMLVRLINSISIAENAQILSPQNMAVPVHEALALLTPIPAMVAN